MKRVWIFIVIFFVSNQLMGQKDNQLNEMIISSINSYITWKNDFVKRGISTYDTCHHYICMDGFPADFPYESLQNITFFSVNFFKASTKSFKSKLKKGIDACFVWLKLTDQQFVVTVGGRGVKLMNKNNIGIIVGDWGIFTYKYSCEKQEWELKETEYGGI